jgi:hypothetical protein
MILRLEYLDLLTELRFADPRDQSLHLGFPMSPFIDPKRQDHIESAQAIAE